MAITVLPLRTGLPPVADASARVLVLGTFPSDISLATRQYYANPQNDFWCFMSAALGVGPLGPGKASERAIKSHHIALWDVFQKARRKGSADAAIDRATALANDFRRFLAKHPQIRLIVFNSQKAESHFCRFVARKQPEVDGVATITLSSTSLANTRMTAAAKKRQWRQLRRRVDDLTNNAVAADRDTASRARRRRATAFCASGARDTASCGRAARPVVLFFVD